MTQTVVSHLTNGFGNNIFQYVAGRLLAEHHGAYHFVEAYDDYYAVSDLKEVGINFDKRPVDSPLEITDTNYRMAYDPLLTNQDLSLRGYFEDYTYYLDHRDQIKSWFPPVTPCNDNALVVHLRTGDRLVMKNEFYTKPTVDNYLKAMKNFHFNELHIVTDMPIWEKITAATFGEMKFHLNIPPHERVPVEETVKYFNAFVDGFAPFNPIIKKRSIVEDFNFIRKFKNILFEHGTLSWWAAFLSEAHKVGVYGPWRPWKGATNKNLSQIPLDSWFRWE